MDMVDKFFSVKYADRGDLFEGLAIWREEKELCLIGEKSVDEAIASFDQRRTPLLSQE